MLAKLSVQGADLGYNQVAEHLAKTHLLMEPFCVSKDRQLSERHPLHQAHEVIYKDIKIEKQNRMFVFLAQDPYFKNPSDEEPFQDIIKYWMRDKVFAEQRLAGVNPMTLMRVTTDRGKQIISPD